MKIVCAIQARMRSARLPGKVLEELGERPILSWVVRAAREAALGGPIVVATGSGDEDDPIVALAERERVAVVRGHPTDVLSRFLQVVDETRADCVVRLTADSPLIPPEVIRAAVATFGADVCDYVGTFLPRTLPLGLGVEVVSAKTLRDIADVATGHHRSHVTSYIYSNSTSFRLIGLTFSPAAPHLRLTVDEPDDLALLREVVARIGDVAPRYDQVLQVFEREPQLGEINAHVRQRSVDAG
ncbi:MAG: NTP transferase domain-containing protein [Actinomycetota bacterium]|nr:NTP transferase domain-containing protein [Actinomycetota bacterium]